MKNTSAFSAWQRKTTFLPEARGRQGNSSSKPGSAPIAHPSSQHPGTAPHAAAAQAPTAKFPASATLLEWFTALALLTAPIRHSLALPLVPQHCRGCCLDKLDLQTFSMHLGALSCSPGRSYKCQPSPFSPVTRESCALPDEMIGGRGSLNIYHQSFKAKNKIYPTTPTMAPWRSAAHAGVGNKGEQVKAEFNKVFKPMLSSGNHRFTKFHQLCPEPQEREGFEFRKSPNTHPEPSLLGWPVSWEPSKYRFPPFTSHCIRS